MKKNILKATIVAAFALIAGMNVYNAQKSDVISDLALANIEALASDEGSGGGTCTVRVSCGTGNSNDFVECSGSQCERHAGTFSRWVKCDGQKTSC
ncbi:NVEALA domain-containing protein [Phocaeicola sartorii]|uniref:NVEALA domain-containing protein n=1 Tax=Phocaeicola sartorii TaxID=671267 RepID=UPI001F56E10F|nr:NVEALA domain-containing protein [Phocaeicola sartorii]